MKTIINIFDLLENLVDNIKLTGAVENLINTATKTYTFDTDSIENLLVGKFITFDNDKEAEITAINGNAATMKVFGSNVPIEGKFKRKDPFFGNDLSIDIASKYASKSTDPLVWNKQKFPSIEINRDSIKSNEDQYNRESFEAINVLFIASTNKEENGNWRDANTYAVLTDLFDKFKTQLLKSKQLIKSNEITFDKEYLDKANYANTNKNAFNHFVDILSVNINNLILNTKQINC